MVFRNLEEGLLGIGKSWKDVCLWSKGDMQLKKVYDVSLPIMPGMPVWPGEPMLSLFRVSSMDDGESANVSRLEMMVHTGTHVDAPLHFIQGGKSVENLDLDQLVSSVLVVEILEDVRVIGREALEKVDFKGATSVLFKTSNSLLWNQWERGFQTQYVGLDTSGALYCVEKGFKLVGIDYLSIAAYHDLTEPHKILLGSGMTIVEGLNLSNVTPGIYQLVCLPLKLVGCDGAPARVILIEE